MWLNFSTNLRLVSFQNGKVSARGASLTVCLSPGAACLFKKTKTQQKAHNLALAAPSITHTFGAAESRHVDAEHQSVVDRVVISTHMFCVSLMRCILHTVARDRARERGQQGGNNGKINFTHGCI